MWRRLYDRKGQSTGEYALVFAIILGAIVAMQTYVKRGIQGRVKAGTDYMASQTPEVGTLTQYDPYYYTTDYETERDSTQVEKYTDGEAFSSVDNTSTRVLGGTTTYGGARDQINP